MKMGLGFAATAGLFSIVLGICLKLVEVWLAIWVLNWLGWL